VLAVEAGVVALDGLAARPPAALVDEVAEGIPSLAQLEGAVLRVVARIAVGLAVLDRDRPALVVELVLVARRLARAAPKPPAQRWRRPGQGTFDD